MTPAMGADLALAPRGGGGRVVRPAMGAGLPLTRAALPEVSS
ncbi:hypothetical protein SAMN05421684_2501 [Asanoa ishikariensis]|uniref:Uncharacterized protein n=1 Tax=Asanoa ishikariensis TaxID=137265 RepID=A0A1H3P1C1_9ACTN|nr:hypothetical protein SAMN05421684_2501 [Asanoa ishikariensis]